MNATAKTGALSELAQMMVSGGIEVVDLSAPLGPQTPLLKLPPDFAKDTPKIEIHTISEYDKDGPFWAWNWLKIGEHSGTHFDAPHHWITGKEFSDGYTDTIPVKSFVAPSFSVVTALFGSLAAVVARPLADFWNSLVAFTMFLHAPSYVLT